MCQSLPRGAIHPEQLVIAELQTVFERLSRHDKNNVSSSQTTTATATATRTRHTWAYPLRWVCDLPSSFARFPNQCALTCQGVGTSKQDRSRSRLCLHTPGLTALVLRCPRAAAAGRAGRLQHWTSRDTSAKSHSCNCSSSQSDKVVSCTGDWRMYKMHGNCKPHDDEDWQAQSCSDVMNGHTVWMHSRRRHLGHEIRRSCSNGIAGMTMESLQQAYQSEEERSHLKRS
eukprot:64553-Hanusia_phi.AAC.4